MAMSDEQKAANRKAKNELRMRSSVRTAVLRIGDIDGDAIESMARWHRLERQVQYATNVIYQQWLVWHVQAGNTHKAIAFLEKFAKWAKGDEKTRGKKAACNNKCFPPALMRIMSREIDVVVTELN